MFCRWAGVPVLLSLVMTHTGGVAQAAPEQAVELETISVTATRREVQVREVAGAVSQVRGEDVMRLAPGVLAAALRGQPGTFFQQTTPGQGLPIVRGLKGSQVLHLVDGMRLNNAFFRDAPNQYFALVDAYAMERIEVLRGAAGSLYGADAMGGVVQVLTAEPRFAGPEWRAEGRLYGAFSGADDGWVLRADTALGREGAAFTGGATWQDRGQRDTARGEIRPSAYEARAVDAKLLLDAGAQGELMLAAQVVEQPSTPRVDELVPGFGQTEPSSAVFLFEPNRREFLHGRYRWHPVSGQLDDLEVHFARQVITDDRRTRDTGSPMENREHNESELDGLTAQFRHSPAEGWRLTWGFEFYRDTVRSARMLTDTASGQSAVVRPRFPDGAEMDSNAVYLSASWHATPRLDLDAGLRYSDFDIDLPATTDSPQARLAPDDFTGDLRLSYEFIDGLRLAANIGRGFRPPNVFDLGTLGPRPGNRFNVSNPSLGPESVWSYDAGIKARGRVWEAEVFVFYLDYADKITSVATGELTANGRTVVRSENRNAVEIHGLEAGLRWFPGTGIEAELVLNYTRGEERDDEGERFPADRIPPFNGRLALTWTPGDRLSLEPFILFAGEQDRLSPRDVLDPRMDPSGTPGWATLNLHMRWRARAGLTLGLMLNNLGDEAYREHGSGIDAPGRHAGLWVNAAF